MSALQSSGLEPEVRLKSLKNAKRRVMPGEEEIQNLDQFNPDIAGTANPTLAPATTQNIPQPMIGSQVSAQSYDPRANQVMTAPPAPVGPPQPVMANPNPPPTNEQRLGGNLPKAVGMQEPPQAKEGQASIPTSESSDQTPYGPQLPPYPLLGSGLKKFWKGLVQKGIGQSLTDIPEGIANLQQEPTELDKEVAERSKKFGYENIPGWMPKPPIKEQSPEVAAQAGQPPISEQEQAIQAHQYHTDQVASQPELVQKFEEQTGKQFTPELQQEVRGAEQVMSDLTDGGNVVETGDDDQAKRLKERILNNQATDADKYMIGLALVMPLIVGGMFGKEAGFGALAGGMKGVSEAYGRRAKDTQEAEELLADINKTKATQTAAALKGDLSAGMKEIEWVNKKTGKKESGKEIANGMAMKKEHLATKEQLKSAEAKATLLQDKMTRSDEILKATRLISDVASQIKDPAFWKQYRNYILSNYDPQLAAKFAPTVIIDGEEQNAATIMQQAIARVNSNYSKLFGLGQPDAAEQRLFGKILSDPTAGFISPAQVKYQADRMNADSIDAILDDAERKGIQLDPEIFPYAEQKREIESTKKAKSGARLASKEIGDL